MEVAVFHEHRFAMYFWANWAQSRKGRRPPALVSLDWHRDLVPPNERERKVLDAIDLSDPTALTVATWIELHPHNDGHVLAAAHRGLLGDIYVLQKQDDEPEEAFEDGSGEMHAVSCFETLDRLVRSLHDDSVGELYFDIDLDYFTESPDPDGGGDVTLAPEGEVRALLDPAGPLMDFILPRVCGMTIALEPEFCGGLRASHRLFEWVDTTLFSPGIGHRDCAWKHPCAA
jgi:hypothetical protein